MESFVIWLLVVGAAIYLSALFYKKMKSKGCGGGGNCGCSSKFHQHK